MERTSEEPRQEAEAPEAAPLLVVDGRTPFGVSFEELSIEYEDEALARAYVRRT